MYSSVATLGECVDRGSSVRLVTPNGCRDSTVSCSGSCASVVVPSPVACAHTPQARQIPSRSAGCVHGQRRLAAPTWLLARCTWVMEEVTPAAVFSG